MTGPDLTSTDGVAIQTSRADVASHLRHLASSLTRLFRREPLDIPLLRVLGRKPLTPAHTMFIVCCGAQRFIAIAHPAGVALWPLPGANERSGETD
jgi:hypothetical protein